MLSVGFFVTIFRGGCLVLLFVVWRYCFSIRVARTSALSMGRRSLS